MPIIMPAINAVVLTAETRRPVPGATVQVHYRVSNQDSRVVPPPALTDPSGRFNLDFNLADIVNPNWPGPPPTPPDTHVPPRPVVAVTFEVTLRGTRLAADGRIDDLLQQDHKVTLLVDESALAGTDSGGAEVFIVTGRVRDTSDFTLPPLEVRAFDRDLRHEELLGSTRTDAKGIYTITYKHEQFRRAEKAAADLVIRVFAPDDKEAKEIAASPIHFNAPARYTVDIELSIAATYGVSECEIHLFVLTPLLEKVGLDELTDDDLRFLLGETGIPWDHLDALRLDAKWSREHKLPAAACYGLLREGLPAALPQLLNEKPSRWRAALKSAIERRRIPLALADQIESILQGLSGLAVDVAFQPTAADAPEAPLGVVLATSVLAPAVQRDLVAAIQQWEGDGDPWEALTETGRFDPPTLATARFTLEANALLQGHLPTLQALQQLGGSQRNYRGRTTIPSRNTSGQGAKPSIGNGVRVDRGAWSERSATRGSACLGSGLTCLRHEQYASPALPLRLRSAMSSLRGCGLNR